MAAAALLGLTMAVAAGTGLLLVTAPAKWIADTEHTSRITSSTAFRPWLLVVSGIVIAGAVLLTPAGLALWASSEWTATSMQLPLTPPTGVDVVLTAILLGAVAGATPVLIVTDLLVRRLPDRIMYPLIGLLTAACLAGMAFGTSPPWWFGLIAACAGLVLFGGLHLVGRLLHQPTMGLGDVKLAVVAAGISGLSSPWAPALVLVLTMLIAGVWALTAGLRAGRLRGTTIAFGPSLLTGMWLGSVAAPFLL